MDPDHLVQRAAPCRRLTPLLKALLFVSCAGVISGLGGYELGKRAATAPTNARTPARIPFPSPTQSMKEQPSSVEINSVVQPCYLLLRESDQPLSLDIGSSWKRYRNARYGYTVRYPGDWSFEEESAAMVTFRPQNAAQATEPPPLITIAVRDRQEAHSHWQLRYDPFYGANLLVILDKAYLFVAGQDFPLDGSVISEAASTVGPRVLCQMLSTLEFTTETGGPQ